MRSVISLLVILSMGALLLIAGCRQVKPVAIPEPARTAPGPTPEPTPEATPTPEPVPGAYETGEYRNVFAECGYAQADIQAKIDEAWQALFYGDDDTRIYFESGDDEAYIMDIGNNDIRSEGMSYGMMMCVQLDKKAEFDKLWKWAKTHMQQTEGPNAGYFAWSMTADGTPNDTGPAPDGEEYFAMSLFFASHRWGDADAPYDYSVQARAILHEALHKPDVPGEGQRMWDTENKLIRFVPGSDITDPSYHLPHFYELFSLWADPEDSQFWQEAAAASREFLHAACHPETGLAPDYAGFAGYPIPTNGHDKFREDAFRVAGNIGLDYAWFAADPWQVEEANRIQAFFVSEGIGAHYSNYKIDGTPIESTHYQSTGLVAMNAMASLAADGPHVQTMVDDLWGRSPGTGEWRYYDDCLYMFALLALSGNYKIY